MIKGLYSAASGMINMLSANDNTANNLANINTPGFKQGVTVFKTFAPLLIDKIASNGAAQSAAGGYLGMISPGAKVASIAFDFAQGELKKSGNNYDLAIKGDGFFEVQTANGQKAYTRDGSFIVNQEGYLTTQDGNMVVGKDNKPIFLGKGIVDFKVDSKGTVLVNNPAAKPSKDQNQQTQNVSDQQAKQPEMLPVGQLKIVDFENKFGLMRKGNNLFEDGGSAMPKQAANYSIVQGSLESSNSNVITTMVKTIEGMRTYETLAKIVETTGGNLEKVVNQLGRVNS